MKIMPVRYAQEEDGGDGDDGTLEAVRSVLGKHLYSLPRDISPVALAEVMEGIRTACDDLGLREMVEYAMSGPWVSFRVYEGNVGRFPSNGTELAS